MQRTIALMENLSYLFTVQRKKKCVLLNETRLFSSNEG
jgi:hypothetical protein